MRKSLGFFLTLFLTVSLINCQEHLPATAPLASTELSDEDALLKMKDQACDPGVLRVMTQNVYVGGDVDIVLEASDPQEIPILVAVVYAMIEQTNFYERAQALAKQIKINKPHLIGLQEISTIFRQSPGDELNYLFPGAPPATPADDEEDKEYDYLEILLAALADQGMDYQAVAIGKNIDIEMPMATLIVGDQLAEYDDVRLIDYDVILARHDVQVIGDPLVVPYSIQLQVPPPPADPDIIVPRGFISVVAQIGDELFRFVSTHLEAPYEAEPIRFLQAAELMAYLETETLPVILVGDFNAPAPDYPTYQSILDGGYHDAWLESPANGDEVGFTFGHDPDLLNPYANFYERIDFIFHRNNQSDTYIKTGPVMVVGDKQNNRTPSGLWPSDHGGVVAKLHLKETSIAHK